MAQDLKTGQADGPMDRLKTEARGLIGALGDRALSSVQDKVAGATDRLTGYVDGGAGPGLMAAVTGAKNMAEGKGPVRSLLGAGVKGATEKVKDLFGKGGKGGQGKKLKVTNIVESVDVGVPIGLAYNQWTQFTDFPSFTKKVENVEQAEDEKLHWKAQVFWSHREWDADIIEQVPDEKIIWRSTGAKGHVDGAVTFHQLAPSLTRVLVVLEYHPQGLFEHTGNLWRAQGRRARLELKHFARHVMTDAILHPEEIEGWRGVIEDGEVVEDHEAAFEEHGGEAAEDRELAEADYDDDQHEDAEDEYEEADDEDEYQEADAEDEFEEAAAEDEYQEADAEDDYEEAVPQDEYEEGEESSTNGQAAAERPARSGRGRRPSGRPQQSGRASRAEGRPQRAVRRRTATRGGNSQ